MDRIPQLGSIPTNLYGLLSKAPDYFGGLLNTSLPDQQTVRPSDQSISKINYVKNLLSNKYSPEVVAGIMGNIDVETKGSFDPLIKQDKGPGRGLFQMEGKMFKAFNKYLKDNDLKNNSTSQINFVSEILSNSKLYDIGSGHRKAMKKVFRTKNVEEIAKQFSERVLRPGKPHLERRLESARKFSG